MEQGAENYHIITDSLHWQNSQASRITRHKLSHYTNWSRCKSRIWWRRTWLNNWQSSIRHICEGDQIINVCSYRDMTWHCICCTHTHKIYKVITAKTLDSYQACFSISQGDMQLYTYLWWIRSRMEAGTQYVLWHWLGIKLWQEVYQWIHIFTHRWCYSWSLKKQATVVL